MPNRSGQAVELADDAVRAPADASAPGGPAGPARLLHRGHFHSACAPGPGAPSTALRKRRSVQPMRRSTTGRLRSVPPARTPRVRRLRRRFLLRQQHGRRCSAAANGDRQAHRDPRHRRASRQRHAGHLLRARRSADDLDPCRPVELLSLLRRLRRRNRPRRGARLQSESAVRARLGRCGRSCRRSTRRSRAFASSRRPRSWSRSDSTPRSTIRSAF